MLYPLAYALKFASKQDLGRDYVVPPLEGLWSAQDMAAGTAVAASRRSVPGPGRWVRMWHAADCEQVRSGLLGQPANAVSAVGYLVAGGWLLVWMWRRGAVPRRYWWFAAAVAANGVGSGLFHGPGWPGSGWCHDVAAVAVPVFVAADGLGVLGGWEDRTVSRLALVATAAVAVGALVGPVTNIALVTAVTAAVLAEAVMARRSAPRGVARAARAVMAAALAVGVAAYVLGRTGGPLCRPDSLLQAHALWHLLTGLAMAAWAVARVVDPRPVRTR